MKQYLLDNQSQILKMDVQHFLQFEKELFYKFQTLPYPQYLEILKDHIVKIAHPSAQDFLNTLKMRPPKIGIYPGSFDPFHQGHLSILLKAEKIFDKVIVAVGTNPAKSSAYCQERKQELLQILGDREVHAYQGYLTDFLNTLNHEVTIIRGLRNGYDLEYELNQLRFIEDMSEKQVNLCFIPCDREYSYLSSTALRNMARLPGAKESIYLPPKVNT